MKENLKVVLAVLVTAFFIPALLFSVAEKMMPEGPRGNEEIQTEPTESTKLHDPDPVDRETVTVLDASDEVRRMDMDDYLTGVLLGEMPVSFDIEALKAQAVVARTYALRSNLRSKKHAQGAVCMDSACCQSYKAPENFLAQGGKQTSVDKVRGAVTATASQVLTYNGSLIEATYFSCSGGRTEDAVAVWGTDIPYLQAVDSPGEENASRYTATLEFTAKEFAERLGIRASGAASGWFGRITYTDGGGVDTMFIAGRLFKGTELRQKLGLNSTAFVMQAEGEKIFVSTRGFGHRVGMSQYGAEAMAVSGSSYAQILGHYYPGAQLEMRTGN